MPVVLLLLFIVNVTGAVVPQVIDALEEEIENDPAGGVWVITILLIVKLS